MPLSYFMVMLWLFLMSVAQLGWFNVDMRLLGFVGLATVVVFILEQLHVVTWTLPGRRVQ